MLGHRLQIAIDRVSVGCPEVQRISEVLTMEDIRDAVVIKASHHDVWDAVRDPYQHAQWHPALTRIEGEHVLGAVRTCEIVIGKKTSTNRERCIVYDEGRAIEWAIEHDGSGFSRMAKDWTAGFTLQPHSDNETRVEARSVFSPRTFLARIMLPLIRRKFHQTQRAILNGLKQHVEERSRAGEDLPGPPTMKS